MPTRKPMQCKNKKSYLTNALNGCRMNLPRVQPWTETCRKFGLWSLRQSSSGTSWALCPNISGFAPFVSNSLSTRDVSFAVRMPASSGTFSIMRSSSDSRLGVRKGILLSPDGTFAILKWVNFGDCTTCMKAIDFQDIASIKILCFSAEWICTGTSAVVICTSITPLYILGQKEEFRIHAQLSITCLHWSCNQSIGECLALGK